jgi:hypothetical protein
MWCRPEEGDLVNHLKHGFPRLAVAVFAAASLAACSSTPSSDSTSSTRPTSSTSSPHRGATLAALPIKGEASSEYPRLLEASGTGSKALGTFKVSGTRVFVQTVCTGSGSLQLVALFAQGPCNDQAGVTSFAAPGNREVTVTVHASAKTKWAIFVSQPV